MHKPQQHFFPFSLLPAFLMCLPILLLSVVFVSFTCTAQTLPDEPLSMISFNLGDSGMTSTNLYFYNPATGTIDTVKGDTTTFAGPLNMHLTDTYGVYAAGNTDNPFSIYVYNTVTKGTSSIGTATTKWESTFFDSEGKIWFIDYSDGAIKKMNIDGSGITTVVAPESPYTFAVFSPSPDRSTIVAIEERRVEGVDYYLGNYDRGALIRVTDGVVLGRTEEFLGEWNYVSWKADSTAFLFYFHAFKNSVSVPKYVLFDLSNPSAPVITKFSGGDWNKEENICSFTPAGYLLSLVYRNLYNGQTGAVLLKNIASVPEFGQSIVGFDKNSYIYFADLDKTNLRQFNECFFTLSPMTKTVNYNGPAGNIQVRSSLKTCGWTAHSNADWITIFSGTEGTGSGKTSYRVAANPSVATRTGTLDIADQTVEIVQNGAPCKIKSISKSTQLFTNAGGTDSFDVVAPEGCEWTATFTAGTRTPQITITGGSTGSGSGTVSYTVGANSTGTALTGKIIVQTSNSLKVSKKTFTAKQTK